MSIKVVPNTILLKKPGKALTINEVISRYEISNQADGKSPRTIAWYTEMLMSFSGYMKVELKCYDLSAFNIDTVRSYIIYLHNKPKFQGHPFTPQQNKLLSPRTVQCHVRALKAFASWLYVEDYTAHNSLQNLKLPKAASKIMEPLTSQEVKKIARSINKKSYSGERNHAMLVTILDSGLRASEAAGITLDNLNLRDGYIKITGKGDKERIVPIGKFVQVELLHYIEKVRPQPYGSDCGKLFLSRGGKPITVNTVKLVFSRLARSSGVNRLHAHLCRHTFAINYLLNGGDIFSLREILGHTTLEMVNHYLHFTSSQITAQHHKYSPMDRMQEKEGKVESS
ncbi:tyrosine-type recombinase/integrase [Chloroflexota bacterium]